MLIFLGLGLIAVSYQLFAETPALYGQDYYRLGKSWDDAVPPPLVVGTSKPGDTDEKAYLAQLQSRELTGGPYSDALAEPLAGLANYYRDSGRYAEAVQLYQRALHVVRVNDGLYTERQVPLVRNLLDAYRQLGDRQALDERYEYFFRLYGNGQPPYTNLRMAAALEYLRWQREAIRTELDDDGNQRMLDMYQLNESILERAALQSEVTFAQYRQLVLSQIRNLYLLQSEIELPDELNSFKSGNTVQAGPGFALDYKLQRLENMLRTSVIRGRSLLESLIAKSEAMESEATVLAGIYLELGDWNQWNDRFGAAQQAYARVIAILGEAGEQQLLEEWLGRPMELPGNGAFWQPARHDKSSQRVVLQAQYNVSSRGDARNVQVSALEPGDEAFTSRLRRKLSATRFRPRYTSGNAQAVEGVSRYYELLVD